MKLKSSTIAACIGICLLCSAAVIGISAIFLSKNSSAPKESVRAKVRRAALRDDASYRSIIDEAQRHFFAGELEAALELYQLAAERFPRELVVYDKIGDIYYLQKKYSAARDNFELASSLNLSNPSVQIKKVRSLLGMRKIFDAKVALESIKVPTAQSLYYEGLIAAFLNDQAHAKDLLQKSITAAQEETIKSNAQKVLMAYRDFELSRDAPIEYLQAVLAYTFDQVGEYGLALELGFDALKTKSDFRDVWIILGHAFLNEERWLDAQGALSKALELDSSHPSAYFFRGISKQYLRKPEEALIDFEAALKYGFQPRILVKLAMADIYFEKADFASAFPLYREVVITDPSETKRFVRPISIAIRHLNKLDEADALARKAYETHPDTALALNLLGWTSLARGNFTDAREYLEKALVRDPDLPEAHLNFGQLNEREGFLSEALASYERASSLAHAANRRSLYETAEQFKHDLARRIPQHSTENATEKKYIPSLSLF